MCYFVCFFLSSTLSSGAPYSWEAGPGPMLSTWWSTNGPNRTELHIRIQSDILREDTKWGRDIFKHYLIVWPCVNVISVLTVPLEGFVQIGIKDLACSIIILYKSCCVTDSLYSLAKVFWFISSSQDVTWAWKSFWHCGQTIAVSNIVPFHGFSPL